MISITERDFGNRISATVIILLAMALLNCYECQKFDERLERVVPNMTRAQVIAILGEPETTGGGPGMGYWENSRGVRLKQEPVHYVQEYYFPQPFPSSYSIFGFDERDRAVTQSGITEL